MKKLIQKAVKVLAFLLVLALCYGLMDQVLKIKTDDMVSMVKLASAAAGHGGCAACWVVAYRDKC